MVAEAIARRITKGGGTAKVGAFLKAGLHEDASVPRAGVGLGLGTRDKGKVYPRHGR